MSVSKKVLSVGLAAVLAVSMIPAVGVFAADEEIPTLDQIKVGEDYQDLKASIKVLTNRTDIVDTVYKGYADEFMKMYPNIKVEYEGITDYEQSLELRLTTGDWGDLCFIPTSVDKSELSSYFTPLGDYDTLDQTYNFVQDKSYEGTVYGIANGGTASGIVYNKRVWKEAGIDELPTTPDEFLDNLQTIKDNTDAVPLYTNFAAGWPMGAWDAYIGVTATGDADYMNNTICHTKDPFAKQDDMTGPYAVYYTMYESVARGLVEDDPASSDWESSKTKMNSGEIATMVLGSWAYSQMVDADSHGEDVGYMPFPMSVNGTQYALAGGDYSYCINVNSSDDNKAASLVFIKWMTEKSNWCYNEGGYTVVKGGENPDMYKAFDGCTTMADQPALPGEENLLNDMNSESELSFNAGGNDKVQRIVEAAATGSETYDDIMADWTKAWNDAQAELGVEVNN